MTNTATPFASRGTSMTSIEAGHVFKPKFDGDGLMPAVVTDAASGAVLMFAFMNADALRLTLETGYAHFWSRSRNALWKKGEESGNLLRIAHIWTDCDQDALWVAAAVEGHGVACHTGAKSCFYRELKLDPAAAGGVALATLGPSE